MALRSERLLLSRGFVATELLDLSYGRSIVYGICMYFPSTISVIMENQSMIREMCLIYVSCNMKFSLCIFGLIPSSELTTCDKLHHILFILPALLHTPASLFLLISVYLITCSSDLMITTTVQEVHDIDMLLASRVGPVLYRCRGN